MTEEPLFDLPPLAPLQKPQSPITAVGPMKWTTYNPLHARKCDDCMQVGLEAWRDGRPVVLARQARHKLSQGGKTIVFICGEHKQIRIEAS